MSSRRSRLRPTFLALLPASRSPDRKTMPISSNDHSLLMAFCAGALLCACASEPRPRAASPVVAPPQPAASGLALVEEPVSSAESAPVLEAETLDEFIALALAKRPEVDAAQRELAARSAEARRAARWINPTVQLDVEDIAGQGIYSDFNTAQSTLTLAQLVERGGKRSSRMELADVAVAQAHSLARLLEADVAARTARAYWRTLQAQGELSLAESMETTTRKFLGVVSERTAAGKVSPIEEAKYTVAMAAASLDRREAERQLKQAIRDLEQAVGGHVVIGRLREPFGKPVEAPELNALRDRLVEGPRFAQLELAERNSIAALRVAESKGKVDVVFSVGLRRYEATDDFSAVIGLGLPVPVFNTQRETREAARQRRLGTTSTQEAKRLALLAELELVWNRVIGAHADFMALEGGVLEDSAWVSSAVEEGYRSGKFQLLDALDAQRTDFEVRARHLRTLAEYHVARAELESLLCDSLHP